MTKSLIKLPNPLAPVLKGFTAVARHILRAEFLTVPGQINALGMNGLFFILVCFLGVSGALQAIIRAWRPNYSTGVPFIGTVSMWIGLTLVCMAFLTAVIGPKNLRRVATSKLTLRIKRGR